MAIRSKLNPICQAVRQIVHEGVGRRCTASTDLPAANQLGIRAKSRPRPNIAIAKLPLLFGRHVLLLGIAERPEIIHANSDVKRMIESAKLEKLAGIMPILSPV
jgi:hypothetical protein